MTRQQAAKELGISLRALDRHRSNNLLRFQYAQGKTGQVVDITPEAVEEFKLILGLPAGQPEKAPMEAEALPALAVPDKALPPFQADASTAQFVADIHAIAEAVRVGQDKDTVPIADRFLVTPDEAAVLAGVSAHSIRTAIKDGSLPARKQGRGWKIRPSDARAWVDKMFEDES